MPQQPLTLPYAPSPIMCPGCSTRGSMMLMCLPRPCSTSVPAGGLPSPANISAQPTMAMPNEALKALSRSLRPGSLDTGRHPAASGTVGATAAVPVCGKAAPAQRTRSCLRPAQLGPAAPGGLACTFLGISPAKPGWASSQAAFGLQHLAEWSSMKGLLGSASARRPGTS